MLQFSTRLRQILLRINQSFDAIKVLPLNVARPLVVPILPLIGEILGHLVQRIPRLKKKPLTWRASAVDLVGIIKGGALQVMTCVIRIDSRHVLRIFAPAPYIIPILR